MIVLALIVLTIAVMGIIAHLKEFSRVKTECHMDETISLKETITRLEGRIKRLETLPRDWDSVMDLLNYGKLEWSRMEDSPFLMSLPPKGRGYQVSLYKVRHEEDIKVYLTIEEWVDDPKGFSKSIKHWDKELSTGDEYFDTLSSLYDYNYKRAKVIERL